LGCFSLSTVTFEFGSKLSRVDASAFRNCSSLTAIWIPYYIQNVLRKRKFRRHLRILGPSALDGIRLVEGWDAIWDQLPERE
jgi:hypothetical protein